MKEILKPMLPLTVVALAVIGLFAALGVSAAIL